MLSAWCAHVHLRECAAIEQQFCLCFRRCSPMSRTVRSLSIIATRCHSNRAGAHRTAGLVFDRSIIWRINKSSAVVLAYAWWLVFFLVTALSWWVSMVRLRSRAHRISYMRDRRRPTATSTAVDYTIQQRLIDAVRYRNRGGLDVSKFGYGWGIDLWIMKRHMFSVTSVNDFVQLNRCGW